MQALKSLNPDILVEGEIGDIGSGSEIHETAPDPTVGLTDPAEAKQFVERTGVDVLAPAVGNMHGMLPSMVQGSLKKHLDSNRIAAIAAQTEIFLTLHGGSGTADEDFRRAIAAGVTMIHINTEIRVAWRQSLDRELKRKPDEVVPYKFLPAVLDGITKVARERLRLFNETF